MIKKWQKYLSENQLDEAIISYVEENDTATFPKILNAFSPFIETRGSAEKGHVSLPSPLDKNVIFFDGIAKDLGDAFAKVINKRVFLHPCQAWMMLVDGGGLNLPIAKKPPRGGYKKPHWMPTIFRMFPNENCDSCPHGSLR